MRIVRVFIYFGYILGLGMMMNCRDTVTPGKWPSMELSMKCPSG